MYPKKESTIKPKSVYGEKKIQGKNYPVLKRINTSSTVPNATGFTK